MDPQAAGVLLISQPQRAAVPRTIAAIGPNLIEEGGVFDFPRLELGQVADFA